jgi:hypothetical protein
MMRRKSTLFAIAVLVGAGIAVMVAQETPAAIEDPTFRGTVNIVLAPTTVLDKEGEYVLGLKSHEFRLFDNGKAQEIKVDEIIAPVSLVVAIQADAKVEAVLPRLQKIGTILQDLVAGENGEVAIVKFDHRFETLQDFTSDPT